MDNMLAPESLVSVRHSPVILSATFTHDNNSGELWSLHLNQIGYIRPAKKFIKFVKRKDGAPRHFLKRILNYIKQ